RRYRPAGPTRSPGNAGPLRSAGRAGTDRPERCVHGQLVHRERRPDDGTAGGCPTDAQRGLVRVPWERALALAGHRNERAVLPAAEWRWREQQLRERQPRNDERPEDRLVELRD